MFSGVEHAEKGAPLLGEVGVSKGTTPEEVGKNYSIASSNAPVTSSDALITITSSGGREDEQFPLVTRAASLLVLRALLLVARSY